MACSEKAQERQAATEPAIHGPPPPKPRDQAPSPLRSIVHVTVLDGDLGRRVRGARVRVGVHRARADGLGTARVRLGKRSAYVVQAAAPGYQDGKARIQFRNHPKVTIRIYRPGLQWTMYGNDPARTQTHARIKVRPPFRMVWSRPMGGLLEFPAVADSGVAFVANAWGSVRALLMKDGRLVWRHDIPGGKMASSVAVWQDSVIVHGMDGNVWVLDRYNGRLLWRYAIGAAVESSPLIWRGIDFFGAWNGNVYALDLRTRRMRWVHRTGAKITSSAARYGGTIYIGDYGGRLRALAAGNGRLRWAAGVNGRIYGTPSVAAGRVFVPSSDGNSLTAFSTSGRYLWRVHTGGYVYSSPAVWAGRVYFGSHTGTFYCVSAASGRILWSFSIPARIGGAPTVVDGIVYFSGGRYGMRGLDARTGRLVFRFSDGDYVPVSGAGVKLLLHGYSRLYAVERRRR
ncbi:MAG: PQQ-binding-like beta-propeller repeat protein [Actinomycetota bacterium]|nr:PQQ-binding-like beta-propeller repeat protein [Actinomycetota bacterium]